ncbi:MAG TPA: hypothetical protein VL381_06080, partial [Rhodocyclaceae bacterium]|nr:hypothetical protein [Rhodocyclaceae bacterium]
MATAGAIRPLLEAREYDPFRVLGLHRDGADWCLRVFNPHADSITLDCDGANILMQRTNAGGIFEWRGETPPAAPWSLYVQEGKRSFRVHDPYAFAPAASEHDLYLFSAGSNYQAYRLLGAFPEVRQEVAGVCFRVWAPNAERVSVIGDFNQWDGRCHPLASLGGSGVWELFIPDLPAGTLYKFELRQRGSGTVKVKADPYARAFEK